MSEHSNGANGQEFKSPQLSELTHPPLVDLTGQVAIVTGGSQGIGRHITLKLADSGAHVVFNSRGKEAAAALEKDAECLKGAVTWVGGDLTQPEVRANIISKAKELGKIDILVNNAGINKNMFAVAIRKQSQIDEISGLADANNLMTSMVGREMKAQGYGRVINITSAARYGNLSQPVYGAAKASQESYGRAVAEELGEHGVTVVSLRLGVVEGTGMTNELKPEVIQTIKDLSATKNSVKAEEAADMVAVLASPYFPNLTRTEIEYDGGMKK